MLSLRPAGNRRRTAIRSTLFVLLAIPTIFLWVADLQAQDDDDASISFKSHAGAPEFSVLSRKDQLFFYPCSQCHAAMEPNPEIRPLNVMHDAEIDHGEGRIWCLNCHDLENRDYLRTLLGEPVDFDESHFVCGGCHANRQRDWAYGVHGKRVANWQGDRTIYACTYCHNPHEPAIAPRAPQPPPPVRAGLERDPGEPHERMPVWRKKPGDEQ